MQIRKGYGSPESLDSSWLHAGASAKPYIFFVV